jgi:hypothetical protein
MKTMSKGEASTKVRNSRASFEEVIVRASAANAPVPADVIASVRKRFDALDQELDALEERAMIKEGDARLLALIDRAEELERLRAYMVPKEEILIEGMSRMSDMTGWAVPPAVLDQLSREVVPQLRSMNLVEARGALRSLYEVYDYWDWWVEDHSRSMRLASRAMLGFLVVFVTLSVFLLHYGHIYSGIFCAGTSGAILSVLAKLPPVLSYGAANAYYHRITSRVGVGIAASMIGMGLLAADMISLQMPGNLTIAKMMEGKDRLCETSEVKPAATAGAADAPAADAAAASKAPGCAPDDHRLSRRAVLLLMALAMLFGFSERALSTFEDKIFPPSSTTVVHSGPPGIPQEPGEEPGSRGIDLEPDKEPAGPSGGDQPPKPEGKPT